MPWSKAYKLREERERMNAKRHIIWIGDYAQDHPLYKPEYDRLYEYVWNRKERECKKEPVTFDIRNKYLCNHTKHHYIDMNEYIRQNARQSSQYPDWQILIQPLPLLTAVGNGFGGGDYVGEDEDLVGMWAGDFISIRDEKPKGYEPILPRFRGDW